MLPVQLSGKNLAVFLIAVVSCLGAVAVSASALEVDTGFADRGFKKVDDRVDYDSEVATDNRGRIYLAVSGPYTGSTVRLHRFKPNGSADLSFGREGVAYMPTWRYWGDDNAVSINQLLIDGKGRPVVTGTLWDYWDEDSDYAFFVHRFTRRGRPDHSFGKMGMVTARTKKGFHKFNSSNGLAAERRGSGLIYGGAGFNHGYLRAVDAQGKPDRDFGKRSLVRFGSAKRGVSLAGGVQALSDGDYLFGGYRNGRPFTARISADGQLRTWYGKNGFTYLGVDVAGTCTECIGAEIEFAASPSGEGYLFWHEYRNAPETGVMQRRLVLAAVGRDGHRLASFGKNGVIRHPWQRRFGTSFYPESIAVIDSKVLLLGSRAITSADTAARVDPMILALNRRGRRTRGTWILKNSPIKLLKDLAPQGRKWMLAGLRTTDKPGNRPFLLRVRGLSR